VIMSFTAGLTPTPIIWMSVRVWTGSEDLSLPAQYNPAVMGRQWCLNL
jgi:hypothetical protein